MCSMSAQADGAVTGYPLPDSNADTESTGGNPADVVAAICSELVTGSEITPGPFTWASANDAAVFTVAVKGVF